MKKKQKTKSRPKKKPKPNPKKNEKKNKETRKKKENLPACIPACIPGGRGAPPAGMPGGPKPMTTHLPIQVHRGCWPFRSVCETIRHGCAASAAPSTSMRAQPSMYANYEWIRPPCCPHHHPNKHINTNKLVVILIKN